MSASSWPFTLSLPEPPNRANRRGHWARSYREDRDYKHAVWAAAIEQVIPFVEPPARVRIEAHFRLWSLRDPDGAAASVKPALDALKQNQPVSDSLRWRFVDGMRASWLTRGYFWDDSPESLELVVTQEVKRGDRGLTLTIEALG